MAFTEEQKQAIHDNLYKSLKGYASIQDINYAASRIIEDPSPENIDKVRKDLINVSAPTTSGVITPDNEIKNIIKNELRFLQSDTEETTDNFIVENITNSLSYGDVVQFGSHYKVNGDTEKSPIEWHVIKIVGDKVQLLSKRVLYSSSKEDFYTKDPNFSEVWKDNAFRKYINTTLYSDIFNDSEKALIYDEVDQKGNADHVRVLTKAEYDGIIVPNKNSVPGPYQCENNNKWSYVVPNIDSDKESTLGGICAINPSTGGGTTSYPRDNYSTVPTIDAKIVVFVNIRAFKED